MGKLSVIDGKELVKVLCNNFGFVALRQKGSHVTLKRENMHVTVPLKEIRTGLLCRILKDCGIGREEFEKFV